jgi:pyrroloquinoline quinone biosynthesis protein B
VKVTILGSGQDGGLPQFGAGHSNDRRARDGDLPERTSATVLVETGEHRLLLDAGPDLRVQWWPYEGLPDAIALTHAHMGHYVGLVHLGEESANAEGIVLFVTEQMDRFLQMHEPWASLVESGSLVPAVGTDHRWEGMTIRLIPVPHRSELTDTAAISVDERVLYVPDIDDWHGWPDARDTIARHDLAILDGTFWDRSELERFQDVPHPPVPETLRLVDGLSTRVVLSHLNHTNPLCDPTSAEGRQVTEAGVEVAYDGMAIDLAEGSSAD